MKTAARIKKFAGDQMSLLLSTLSKEENSFSKNDFHNIRVAIKRLRALFALVNKTQPNFKRKKLFSPFQTLFDQAGEIRELEVMQEMLHQYPFNPSIARFELQLDHEIPEEQTNFSKLLKPALIKNLKRSHSKIDHYLSLIDQKDTTRFLKKKSKTIHRVLEKDGFHPQHVHDLRKEIKDYYYLQKMLTPKFKHDADMDEFQERIGRWHDGSVLKDSLEKFIEKENLLPENLAALQSLKRKIEQDNDLLLSALDKHKEVISRSIR